MLSSHHICFTYRLVVWPSDYCPFDFTWKVILLGIFEESFLDGFLKNLSFKIAMSGWAGGCRVSSKVYLFVNHFSELYVSFILQWIAFIFGR